MFTLSVWFVETITGPLLLLFWLIRAFFLGGAALFLLAAPVAHRGMGIACLYLGQAVAMTAVLRVLRRLRVRVLAR